MLGWSSLARMWASFRYASTSSGVGDSFRVWHLDRHRAVEIIVVSKIDPSEPALTQATDDPVTPDSGGIAVRGATRTLNGRLRAFGFRQVLRLIRGAIRTLNGRLRAFSFRRFFVSSIARSLTTTDLIHDCQAEPLSHPEPGKRSEQGRCHIRDVDRLYHHTPGINRYRTRWAYSS